MLWLLGQKWGQKQGKKQPFLTPDFALSTDDIRNFGQEREKIRGQTMWKIVCPFFRLRG